MSGSISTGYVNGAYGTVTVSYSYVGAIIVRFQVVEGGVMHYDDYTLQYGACETVYGSGSDWDGVSKTCLEPVNCVEGEEAFGFVSLKWIREHGEFPTMFYGGECEYFTDLNYVPSFEYPECGRATYPDGTVVEYGCMWRMVNAGIKARGMTDSIVEMPGELSGFGVESGGYTDTPPPEVVTTDTQTRTTTTTVDTQYVNRGILASEGPGYWVVSDTAGVEETKINKVVDVFYTDGTRDQKIIDTVTTKAHPVTSITVTNTGNVSVDVVPGDTQQSGTQTDTSFDIYGDIVFQTVSNYAFDSSNPGGQVSQGDGWTLDGFVEGLKEYFGTPGNEQGEVGSAVDSAAATMDQFVAAIDGVSSATGLETGLPAIFTVLKNAFDPSGGQCMPLMWGERDILAKFCEEWDSPGGGREVLGWFFYIVSLFTVYYLWLDVGRK